MNGELIAQLNELARLIEYKDPEGFRAEAYRRAARSIERLNYKITLETCPNTTTRKISGIGKGIAPNIEEYCKSGVLPPLAELRNDLEIKGLRELTGIVGVGSITAKKWMAAGIYSRADLWREIRAGTVKLTPAQSIGLRYYDDLNRRIPRALVAKIFEELRGWLPARSEVAGSYRRGAENSGDIDIILCGVPKRGLYEDMRCAAVIMTGRSKTSIVWCSGQCVQVDLLTVGAAEYFTSLQYFTGSAQHNEYLRGVAKKKGMTLNEHGLWRGGKALAIRSEEDIYKALGVDYIPPNYR
jgi:DNA polymerase (family X)